MSKIFLFLFLLVLSSFSHANDVTLNKGLVAKIAKKTNSTVADVQKSLKEGCSSGVTLYMRQCAYLYEVGAEISLNETYRKLMGALNTTSAKEKLLKAQRAWVVFRNTTCEYEADSWTDGTGYSIINSGCLTRMADQRTEELNEYMNCKEAGCPGDIQ